MRGGLEEEERVQGKVVVLRTERAGGLGGAWMGSEPAGC